MIELANNEGQGPIGVREIAARQGIPERFLEQLISSLRRSGLVSSHRGAQGGFALAKRPKDISAFDIVEALEGPFNPVACLSPNDESCEKNAACATQNLWRQAKCAIETVFRANDLETLKSEQMVFDGQAVSAK